MPAPTTAHELGLWGEEIAATYLKNRGYEILKRNWRSTSGEVDIIAKESGEYVLAEVKTIRSKAGEFPEYAIDENKIKRYGRLAREFLAQRYDEVPLRFDVIAITVIDDHRANLRHITNAFTIDE